MSARSVRYCPGANANSGLRSLGIAKPMETLAEVWRRISATLKAWNRLMRTLNPSNAFECVERLETILATPMRLAGRRAEFADLDRSARAATRTEHGSFLREQRAARGL